MNKGTNAEKTLTDIIIIGAGASGMYAALTASKAGAKVTLLEHTDRIGRKILSTGNGKCNLGHTNDSSHAYYGSGAFLTDRIFERYGTEETISFFNSIGLFIRERDGYLYPYSETASSVLDVLRYEISQNNIDIVTDFRTESIRKDENLFYVKSEEGRIVKGKALILCAGGMASPVTGSDGSGIKLANRLGHRIVDPIPALVKIKSDSTYCKMFDGVRAKGRVIVYINDKISKISEQGEIQFTKDGLSGIPIFNISREIGYLLKDNRRISVKIDLIPEIDIDRLKSFYLSKKNTSMNISAEELFTGLINKKLMIGAMKAAKISPSDKAQTVSEEKINVYLNFIKEMFFRITGTYGFDNAQVMAGGIDCSEVNDNLSSKIVDGLFLAGEILDVDGICGGYNLKWAWSSGYIAAYEAVEYIK